jgi:serine/threonine protein kinase/tetratricopeptide (TPR) repeat protein
MNPANQPGPRLEKKIFEQAVELGSTEARLEFLQGVCGSDVDLLTRLQTLLRAHDESSGFLPDNPVTEATEWNSAIEDPGKAGAIIGRYKLLQTIGEGGCGVVYMAEQEVPVRRRVALKVIKLGMDTREVIARFDAERQALAMMDHPNIAKVLDAGATDKGRPFFAMELVKGIPITKYCDENNLSTEERLKLFAQVCNAVQHAHQKGIIHRDIKPSNILVTLHDGVPVPKVIDFGIAKATQGRLTDHTLFTAFEQFIGTPAYMSPEQAEMSGLDIDTRSDIYSLGVLLYELLTGSTPFETKALMQAGLDEMRRQIREVEPQRPSTRLRTLATDTLTSTAQHRRTDAPKLFNLIHGDLDWIVMRCLEKDRTRRYETAFSLAKDLQRHLGNEPVEARPVSRVYRFRKMVQRNRLAFAAGTVVTISLVVGIIVSTTAYLNEKTAHGYAVEAARRQLKQFDVTGRQEALVRIKKSAIDAAKSAYAVQIIDDVIKGAVSGSVPSKDQASFRQFLDPTAEELCADVQLPAEAKQELCDRLGDLYMAMGAFPQAETMYRQTLALRRQLFGAVHPETTAALGKLIESLKRQGKEGEVEQTRREAQASQQEFLHSDAWATSLKSQAQELQGQRRYAEAEASVREAMSITQKNRGDQYDPYPDLGQIADIRLEAGDLSAAKQLAAEWLQAERTSRAWGPAGALGRLFETSDTYPVPSEAFALLGLAALREGDRAKACDYLLRSTIGVTPGKKPGEYVMELIGKNTIRLATELTAAGEQRGVLRFIEQVRIQTADVFGGRTLDMSKNHSDSWSSYYVNAAKRSENAERLDGWRTDVLAGRVPADWQGILPVAPVAAVSPAFLLPPMQRLPGVAFSLPSLLLRPLLPFSVLLLGWCSTAVVTLRREAPQLSHPAGIWLLAFCLVRTLDAAVEAATLFGEGFFPNWIVGMILSFASWAFLWEFTRALAPVRTPHWETRLVRGTCWGCVAALGIIDVINYLSKTDWVMAFTMRSFMLSILAMILLAITVSVTAGFRLWRWVEESGLSRGQGLILKFAAWLLGAYWLTAFFGPIIHDRNPPLGVALLWASALLPWFLAAGFNSGKMTKPGE